MPYGHDVPTGAADRLGVFKQYADVPDRHRLRQFTAAFDGRDVFAEYDAETGALTTDSERQQDDLRRAVESWSETMADRDVHPALATPADVEAWARALLDGTDSPTARPRSAKRAYNPFWVTIEQFYDWMAWHADYPHAFNSVVMAAAEYPDGASGAIWHAKTASRDARTDGGRVLLTDGGEDVADDVDAETLEAAIGEAFGLERDDPWAEYAPQFADLDAAGFDAFELFLKKRYHDKKASTVSGYETVFKQWRAHMDATDDLGGRGRHPACPNEKHIYNFIRRQREQEGKKRSTVRSNIAMLARAFDYFANNPKLPHSGTFDPFSLAVEDYPWEQREKKEVRYLPLPELQAGVRRVTHLRDRAILVLQLKLGLRAGEIRNMQIQDLSLPDPDLREHYRDLGTHSRLREGGHTEAVVIPSRYDRDGNKSQRARILPLDHEARNVLTRYLLIRPDDGKPWVFLSRATQDYIRDKDALGAIWEQAFPRDEYGETDTHRPITSHYGRHHFTTYWESEYGLGREKVKYMRGDTAGRNQNREAIDEYLHPDYRSIEETYRENIYRLGV